MAKKIIAIDREYASGGREVGKLLSKSLNIPFYDGELLITAAERFGFTPDVLKTFDENASSNWLYNFARSGDLFYEVNTSDPANEVYEAVSKTIEALANEGSCIFIGRCADHILKKKMPVISVFIYASCMEDKVNRAINTDKVPKAHVKEFIAKKDKQRKEYHGFFTGDEWGDKKNYDLCLNTSILGYETCVEILKHLYEKD